ncbi:MAG: hypothetical protein Q9159_003344 [Coniocarpon cinnabarinum]
MAIEHDAADRQQRKAFASSTAEQPALARDVKASILIFFDQTLARLRATQHLNDHDRFVILHACLFRVQDIACLFERAEATFLESLQPQIAEESVDYRSFDPDGFSASEPSWSAEWHLTLASFTKAIQSPSNPAVLQQVYIFLDFFWSMAATLLGAAYLDDHVPWNAVAKFGDSLSAELDCDKFTKLLASATLSDGECPLSEDYMLQRQIYSRGLFPPEWFAKTLVGLDEKITENHACTDRRKYRIKWLIALRVKRTRPENIPPDPEGPSVDSEFQTTAKCGYDLVRLNTEFLRGITTSTPYHVAPVASETISLLLQLLRLHEKQILTRGSQPCALYVDTEITRFNGGPPYEEIQQKPYVTLILPTRPSRWPRDRRIAFLSRLWHEPELAVGIHEHCYEHRYIENGGNMATHRTRTAPTADQLNSLSWEEEHGGSRTLLAWENILGDATNKDVLARHCAVALEVAATYWKEDVDVTELILSAARASDHVES